MQSTRKTPRQPVNFENTKRYFDEVIPKRLPNKTCDYPRWWPEVPAYAVYPNQQIEEVSVHSNNAEIAKWKKNRLPGVQFFPPVQQGMKQLANPLFSAYCQYQSQFVS